MTAPIDVCRLGAGDADRLRDVVAMLPPPEWRAEAVPSYLRRVLSDPRIHVFAAFDGDRPVGFASAYRFPSVTETCDLGYVYDLFVAEADRGKGIGRRIMDALLAALKQDGVSEAWVGTDLDNEAARRLYLSAGAGSSEPYMQYEYTFSVGAGVPPGAGASL